MAEWSNSHLLVNSFPLSFSILLLLFELCKGFFKLDRPPLFKIRIWFVSLLVISTLASFISGFWAAETALNISTSNESDILWHQNLAYYSVITLGSLLISFIALLINKNSRILSKLYILNLVLFTGLLVITNHLGAELIFRFGIGVSSQ